MNNPTMNEGSFQVAQNNCSALIIDKPVVDGIDHGGYPPTESAIPLPSNGRPYEALLFESLTFVKLG